MSTSAEYVKYIQDLLSGFSNLTTKKFFGGIALRSNQFGVDTQFAMILNDVLYFVVDDLTRLKYQQKRMQPFSYKKKTGMVTVKKYYAAPEELFEDDEQMKIWATEALEAAVRLR